MNLHSDGPLHKKTSIRFWLFIRKHATKLLMVLLLYTLSFIFVFPMIFTISNSFMTENEIEENYDNYVTANEDFNPSKKIYGY